jgi:hypothetical protein
MKPIINEIFKTTDKHNKNSFESINIKTELPIFSDAKFKK